MDRIQEKVSYMAGLAEGLELYQNKKEGKFLEELMNVISEMNEIMQHMARRLSELEEYVEAIDEDLNDLEVDYYDEFDLDDIDDEEVIDVDDGIQYYEIECPSCHELIMVDQDLFEDKDPSEVVCPNCGNVFVLNNEETLGNM